MKFKSLLTLLSLFCLSLTYGQNKLSIPDIKAGIGEKTKILVQMDNMNEVTGFQFTLNIDNPNLIFNEKEATITNRKDDHILSVRKINSSQYLFLGISLTNKVIKGNSGTLLEIPIEIPLSYQVGQQYNIRFTDVILSSIKAENIGSAHTDGKLVIMEGDMPDLTVSSIKMVESNIKPNGTITVSWNVDNIGKRSAVGGWIEQVSLVSQATGAKYLLGQVDYKETLEAEKSISRNAGFNIPKIPKLDGNVKVEINIIPDASVKEPDLLKENNIVLSTATTFLEKLVYLTLNKNSIEENSQEVIRAVLTRSGDVSSEDIFQLSCSQENQLDFPKSAAIAKGQSANTIYVKTIDNNVSDGNRTVVLSFAGSGYPIVSESLEIIDNEFSSVQLSSSKTEATDGETITITLQTDVAKKTDTRFSIAATEASRWNIPSEVILPAGSKNVDFQVNVKDTKKPDPEVSGEIRAIADGFIVGKVIVKLKSANIPAFEFIISPDTISEGDGMNAAYATIKRISKPGIPVRLKLSADKSNTLIFNDYIDFIASTNEVKFKIGVVDNDIVDNNRKVTLTASVLLASCGCTSGAGQSGASLSQTITVLDNDGPALKVLANPATVKAGKENASKINIQRNTTDLSNAVTLKLLTTDPSVVSIPETAVIPSGQASIDVWISTKIVPDKKGDQLIRIQATADNYSSGFGWILVSDQNKPDVVVKNVNPISTTSGGSPVQVVATIENQGFTTLTKNTKISYYLSKNTTTTGATPLDSVVIGNDILPGNSIDFAHTVQLPELAGNYYLIVVANSDNKVDELSFDNNTKATSIILSSGYTATSSVSKSIYKPGETITISGAAKMIDNTLAANKEVELVIANGAFERSFKIKTNDTGKYVYDFESLLGEAGNYTIAAGYPGNKTDAQANFDILGFEWLNKENLKWEVTEGQLLEKELKIKNNTKTNLTNIKINLPENADFTIQANTLTLSAGQEGILKYTIKPNKASVERKFSETKVSITSTEGAVLDITAWYYCHPQTAQLTAEPVNINTTMTKGASRYYEVMIVNTGSIPAENVKIELPKLNWMTLRSPQTIKLINPFDTAKVVLELMPTEKEQLNVPLSGSIAVNLTNGKGLQIPFKIEPVSESTGSLRVDVVDEYTYNTQKAPHLKGAKVIVRHPFSGAILAEGTTDENGLFNATELPEGYYTISVSADKHSNYQNNILIDPGKTNEQTIFLSYQAISYEWVVRPTEIEDQYETTLEVKFETNVPKPVLVFDINQESYDLAPGQSHILNVTVTNHGLINAEKVRILTPEADGYTFTLLTDYIDVINAKSSVVVPLVIHKNEITLRSRVACWHAELLATYSYYCFAMPGYDDVRALLPAPNEPNLVKCAPWGNSLDKYKSEQEFLNYFFPKDPNDPNENPISPPLDPLEIKKYLCKKMHDDIYSPMRSATALEELELRAATEDNSVCASVTIQFLQRTTMTREAFEGTLTISNGNDKEAMKEVKLDLIITDENDVDCTNLFQINKKYKLDGISDMDGNGTISAQGKGAATVLFIPTKLAAPTVTKSYSFGGILSYIDPETGEKVSAKLYPITLDVNPSPDLVLHYFIQRDILGDDPLTEDITEPMIPSEMALMIQNEGYGIAKNIIVESAQPKIIDNIKGLAIDFNIIGSNFNNEPKQLGLMNINFGNIEPQKSAIGQWWFTSNLLGHFIEYNINVTHLNSYGNKNLSLIKDYQVHELIKSVKAYGAGQDDITDFLVNDQKDIDDDPDAIFYSNGSSDQVYVSQNISVSNVISSSNLTSVLTMKPDLTGWNYGNLNDPGSNKYKLDKVVRKSDSKEIPIENFWQTSVTLRDDKNPLYENKLHFLDKISGEEQYTLYYTSVGKDVPEVVSFERVPDKFSTTPVEYVQVNFNKPIDVNSFGTDAISLIYEGASVSTKDVLIGKITDSSYLLTIKPITTTSGYYELTVHCDKLKDTLGIEGVYGKKIGWTQIIGELGISTFTKKQEKSSPVDEVEILFNKQVASEQLTADKILLNGKTMQNINITPKDANQMAYIVSGLAQYNSGDGTYEFSINMLEIEALDHTKGLVIQSCKWEVSIAIPKVEHLTPQYQGAVNNQNITDMLVAVNKPIINFKSEYVNLYKGSIKQELPFTISKQDSLHYLVSGLGEYTATAGIYKFIVDQSALTDQFGNNGNGTADTTWIVKFDKPLEPKNMHITPDRGISNKDNITSGNDLSISITAQEDKQTIRLYVVTLLSRVLIGEVYVATSGNITIPLSPSSSYQGKITFEAIALDESGNESLKTSMDAYIDVTDLTCDIKTDDCGEIDQVMVTFNEDIDASGFNENAVIVKSAGINLPTKNIVINKISDRIFEISNFTGMNDKGDKTIGIDLSLLTKKTSGLSGVGSKFLNIGDVNIGLLNIYEDVSTSTQQVKRYLIDEKYNVIDPHWNVIGGQIVESDNRSVSIEWDKEEDVHSISLSYKTTKGCLKVSNKDVDKEVYTDLPIIVVDNNSLTIAPNPNNGNFTIFMENMPQGVYNLDIFDVSGRKVYTMPNLNISSKFALNMETGLSNKGFYFLVIHNENKKYLGKFIIK